MKFVFYSSTITMMHGPINITGHIWKEGNSFEMSVTVYQERRRNFQQGLQLHVSTSYTRTGTTRQKDLREHTYSK